MTGARDIHVVSVWPGLPVLLDWAATHPEVRLRSGVIAVFKAGWHSRDDEIAALRAEIERLKGEQP